MKLHPTQSLKNHASTLSHHAAPKTTNHGSPLSRCIKVEKEVDGPPPAAALGDAVHVRGGLVVGRDHAVAG